MDRTKAIINKTIISVNGALYKQTSVIIDEMGRLFWVSLDDITIIKP